MDNRKTTLSYILLILTNLVFMVLIGLWPAREIWFAKGELELAGAFLEMFSMVFWIPAFFISVIAYSFIIRIGKMPAILSSKVILISLIIHGLSGLAVIGPSLIQRGQYSLNLQKFAVEPKIIEQNLDTNNKIYNFKAEVNNKSSATFYNIKQFTELGFEQIELGDHIIWGHAGTSQQLYDFPPGKTVLSGNVSLDNCEENKMLYKYPVKLKMTFISEPSDKKDWKHYLKKEFLFTPQITGIDFDSYYHNICRWFEN